MEEIQQPQINDVWETPLRANRLSPLPLLQLTEGMPCRDAAAMLASTQALFRSGAMVIHTLGCTMRMQIASQSETLAHIQPMFGVLSGGNCEWSQKFF